MTPETYTSWAWDSVWEETWQRLGSCNPRQQRTGCQGLGREVNTPPDRLGGSLLGSDITVVGSGSLDGTSPGSWETTMQMGRDSSFDERDGRCWHTWLHVTWQVILVGVFSGRPTAFFIWQNRVNPK